MAFVASMVRPLTHKEHAQIRILVIVFLFVIKVCNSLVELQNDRQDIIAKVLTGKVNSMISRK